MADIASDKPKAEKVEGPPDNNHLRADDKSGPKAAAETEKKGGASTDIKPEQKDSKAEGQAPTSVPLIASLDPKDWKASGAKSGNGHDKAAATKLFDKGEVPLLVGQERAEKGVTSLIERTSSAALDFAKQWLKLPTGDLTTAGSAGDTKYLSEKFNLSGVFKNPLEGARPLSFSDGLCLMNFQPAGGPGVADSAAILKAGFKLEKADQAAFQPDGFLASSIASMLSATGIESVKGFVGKEFSDMGSSIAASLSDLSVDTALEQMKKAGSRVISLLTDSEKSAGTIQHEGSAKIEYEAYKPETSIKAQDSTIKVQDANGQITHKIVDGNGERSITQSHPDKDGRREIKVEAGNTTFEQDREGNRLIANKNSDIVVKQKADGTVEAFDKTGAKIADFNKDEDARLYFKNAVSEVAKPGESVEDAYKRLQKEHGTEIQGKPVLVVSGTGESLHVQPDGTITRNHANGKAEMILKVKDEKGQEQEIHVRVRQGEHGQFIKLWKSDGHPNGQEIDLQDKRAHAWLKGSRLDIQNGQLMIESAAPKPGEQLTPEQKRQAYHQLLQNGILNVSPDTKINTITGQITHTDGDKQTVFSTNKNTQVVTAQTFKLKEDGTTGDKPERTFTFDHGKQTIQGPKPEDKITFDSTTRELHAFNVLSKPGADAVITGEHGERTVIDKKGDVKAYDDKGRELVSSHGDQYSYDAGRSSVDYHEKRIAQQTEAARQAVAESTSVLSEVAGLLNKPDISFGAIGALRGKLSQIIAKCGELGIAIPGEVSAAKCSIDLLQAKANSNNDVGRALAKEGLDTAPLRCVADNIYGGTAAQKAAEVLHHMGYTAHDDRSKHKHN